jgi:endogenous inhibitor of DNA gyrase (YacG/DUF329 family)
LHYSNPINHRRQCPKINKTLKRKPGDTEQPFKKEQRVLQNLKFNNWANAENQIGNDE